MPMAGCIFMVKTGRFHWRKPDQAATRRKAVSVHRISRSELTTWKRPGAIPWLRMAGSTFAIRDRFGATTFEKPKQRGPTRGAESLRTSATTGRRFVHRPEKPQDPLIVDPGTD